MYTLDAVVVEADRTKNKFGDTITEQSYYRTGGDVKVITREEIEKRHYVDLTEAIKRIPGVTFQNPGYRGGEYGFSFFNNGVAINGDFRVVILVDGRRVDNAASERNGTDSYSSNKGTGVDFDQVTNIDNVDKIEVIKGPGASVYGSDAMGGVINIITRKGGMTPTGSIDLATGSVNQHRYSVNYSGSAGDDDSLHYFVSASRTMSGDTKYRDGWYDDKEGTLPGSRYKENGVNLRIDKEFDENRNLKIWYNHKDGRDGYPITTPAMKYYNEKDWKKAIFQTVVGKLDSTSLENGYYKMSGKGLGTSLKYESTEGGLQYQNLFALDGGVYGSYNRFRNNDLDIVYTFNKDNGMDSFIRYYRQNHHYDGNDTYTWGWISDDLDTAGDKGFDRSTYTSQSLHDLFEKLYGGLGANQAQFDEFTDKYLAPFPGGDKSKIDEWLKKTGGKAGEPTGWHDEQNHGFQLQYAKSLGIHDVISSVTWDRSKMISHSVRKGVTSDSTTKRDTIQAYVQDKIHLTDKWDFTPAIRFAWYDSFGNTSKENDPKNGVSTTQSTVENSKNHSLNYAINTEYLLNDSTSMYAGWTRIYRPVKAGDYSGNYSTWVLENGNYVWESFPVSLNDEEGNAWTVGIRKDLNENTTLSLNYDITKMSNSIALLPIWNVTSGQTLSLPINAREDKQSINITLDTKIGSHWNVSLAYDHMKDKWSAKDGVQLGPNWKDDVAGDINADINELRPQNHYSLNVAYESDKWYSGILANLYTGMSRTYFSDNQFLVLDWNLNYNVSKDLTLYALVSNLTDTGYQITAKSTYGYLASMPGRSFLIGAKYKF